LEAGRDGRAVLYTVLTVPPAQRDRFRERKPWRRTLRRFWAILKRDFGALFGAECSHPAGDEDPDAFHPHANFLWVQRQGFRPYIDVDALRRAWAKILGVEVVDVHHQYLPDVSRIIHRCRYVTRTWPGWGSWLGSMRWYGCYPKDPARSRAVCLDCGMPFLFLGLAVEEEIVMWKERPWAFRPLYSSGVA